MMNLMNYSLTQLEYVLAVHKFGHFGKAAEACHITQPTLSMQIQKLETNLGVIIFDRSKKPVLLTDIGKKMLDQIQKILHEAKQMEQIILHKETAQWEGLLSIGVIPTVAPYLLPKLLPKMKKLFPSVLLNIHELQTNRIIESLHSDEIDVGILAIPLNLPHLFEESLYYEPFLVFCNENHELSRVRKAKYSSLKYDDLWLLEDGHCLRNQILDICSLKKANKNEGRTYKNPYQFEGGSLETLKKLVHSYGGYTLLPSMSTEDLLVDAGHLIPFERPIPARQIGLIFRREHYKKSLLKAIHQSIQECIPEQIRKLRLRDLELIPVDQT